MKRPKFVEYFSYHGLTPKEIAEKYSLSIEDYREYRHDFINNEGHNENGDQFNDVHYYLMDFCKKQVNFSDCLSANFK